MRHLDLFSGIGGFALAAQWVWGEDHEIHSFVEIEPFCQKVLKKHWPDVPIHDDIRTYKHNGTTIDIITGGFPCQPFSCAGKQRSKDDDRYLWPEMLRVIQETRPAWIIGENVAGIINLALDEVCASLENEGYEVQPFIIPACAIDAPHRRDRVWIIANAGHWNAPRPKNGKEFKGSILGSENASMLKRSARNDSEGVTANPNPMRPQEQRAEQQAGGNRQSDETTADTRNQRLQGGERAKAHGERRQDAHGPAAERHNPSWDEPWLEVATRLCGVFDGLSRELDKNGGLNEKINLAGQDLPCLWRGFQSESLQWHIGRFNTLQEKENLFAIMWKHFEKSYRQDNLPFKGEAVQEAYLRNVWIGTKPGCTSQGWRYNEQHAEKYSDPLSRLSYEIALETKTATERYKSRRVDRLKSLGNAIVPQVVVPIMQAIKQIEPNFGQKEAENRRG